MRTPLSSLGLLVVAALVALPAAAGAAPLARAGRPFLAYPGETIVLDGAESEGDDIAYRWVQVGGPEVPLSGGDTARPRFEVAAPGRYSFELVVREGEVASAPDVVDVVVIDADVAGRLGGGGCAHAPAGAVAGLVGGLLALAGRRRRG